jgi:hypothetical protein
VANIAKKRKEKRKRKKRKKEFSVLNYVSRIESKIEHRSTEISVYLSKVTVYSPNERLFLVRSENHSSIKGNTDSDEGILSMLAVVKENHSLIRTCKPKGNII